MYGTRDDAATAGGLIVVVLMVVLGVLGYNKLGPQQETYTAVITVCSTEDSYAKNGHDYVIHLPEGRKVFMDVEETLLGGVRRDRLDTEIDFQRLTDDVATYGPSTYEVTIKGRPWLKFDNKPNLITYKLANVQTPKLCDAKKVITA